LTGSFLRILSNMPRDPVKEVKVCYILNIPNIAKTFHFTLFEKNFLPRYL